MSMRNDANDDFDDVPSLRADVLDDDYPPTARTVVHSRTAPVVKVKAASTGPLWALVGALQSDSKLLWRLGSLLVWQLL